MGKTVTVPGVFAAELSIDAKFPEGRAAYLDHLAFPENCVGTRCLFQIYIVSEHDADIVVGVRRLEPFSP